jgi:hypothetical protein
VTVRAEYVVAVVGDFNNAHRLRMTTGDEIAVTDSYPTILRRLGWA